MGDGAIRIAAALEAAGVEFIPDGGEDRAEG
jgi:hypothetical protein